jgi:hypothetical protein
LTERFSKVVGMKKPGRFWDWLQPGLICLCPMGALAYYTVQVVPDPSPDESRRIEGRVLDLVSKRGLPVMTSARP